MEIKTISVQIWGVTGEKQIAGIKVSYMNKHERTLRAVKVWAVCWSLATVSVLIPALHFFLVPGLLIAGPIVARVFFKQEYKILEGKVRCPNCPCEFELPHKAITWPYRDTCVQCRNQYTIDLRETKN